MKSASFDHQVANSYSLALVERSRGPGRNENVSYVTAEHVSHAHASRAVRARDEKGSEMRNDCFRVAGDTPDGIMAAVSSAINGARGSSPSVVRHSHYKWSHPRTHVCLCRHQFRAP